MWHLVYNEEEAVFQIEGRDVELLIRTEDVIIDVFAGYHLHARFKIGDESYVMENTFSMAEVNEISRIVTTADEKQRYELLKELKIPFGNAITKFLFVGGVSLFTAAESNNH